jgi:hypothetical protein
MFEGISSGLCLLQCKRILKAKQQRQKLYFCAPRVA